MFAQGQHQRTGGGLQPPCDGRQMDTAAEGAGPGSGLVRLEPHPGGRQPEQGGAWGCRLHPGEPPAGGFPGTGPGGAPGPAPRVSSLAPPWLPGRTARLLLPFLRPIRAGPVYPAGPEEIAPLRRDRSGHQSGWKLEITRTWGWPGGNTGVGGGADGPRELPAAAGTARGHGASKYGHP